MNPFDFVIDDLYYRGIERPILKQYKLGIANSSSIPPYIHFEGNHCEDYYINATNGSIEFNMQIGKRNDGKYDVTCFPITITKK